MGSHTSWRHSLTTRLLAASVIVGASAVAATAWLTVHTTTEAIQGRQSQTLAGYSKIYNSLLTYAATHSSWADARPVIRELSRDTGQRILLVSGALRLDTARPGTPAPSGVSAVVDAVDEDSSLVTDPTSNRIARAAVGPFRLDATQSRRLQDPARKAAGCLRKQGFDIHAEVAPSGRPFFGGTLPADTGCLDKSLTVPTPNERSAARQLQRLMSPCLHGDSIHYRVQLVIDVQSAEPAEIVLNDGTRTYSDATTLPQQARTCLTTARREQLAPYVAPPGQLYVTEPNGQQTTARLGSVSLLKVAIAGGIVLVISTLLTAVTASRLVRPLRRLTVAAQRVRDGDIPAVAATNGRYGHRRDEVGRLTEAFNDMTHSRQEAEAARRTMVADIAHELRTPLSNIRGWLEAIEDDVAEPTPQLISSLTRQSIQLQHVVDDLQDIAIADAGKLTLHRGPVDAGDLLTQVGSACGAEASAASVSIIVGNSDLVIENADPIRLCQALTNLVVNAIHYTQIGGTVTLAARSDGALIAIDVSDNGTGIAEEDLPHIFDRFWRADPSRARQSGGSGLGLAIVKRLAQAHGGDISVRSTFGTGSTFTLRVPR